MVEPPPAKAHPAASRCNRCCHDRGCASRGISPFPGTASPEGTSGTGTGRLGRAEAGAGGDASGGGGIGAPRGSTSRGLKPGADGGAGVPGKLCLSCRRLRA